MNKKLIKQINMLALLTLAISLFACTDINKKITISNNTNKEILLEEDEISELINKGKKLLNDERYDEANAYFNKALELDKSNKNLYLKIKDIYLEANRLDDAYFLIKSAISNNVDV
ncbi:MAG: tetratricopeptide repeat protein, partial [Clostridiales bacterium]|nr:tetratricopeptide repeat protein [Clostridiales bacterium]